MVPNLDRIPKWRRDGLTEEQVAKKLGIAYSTFKVYKEKHSALSAALKKGKEELVEELEDSLYKRAMGFEYEETKEEYESGILVKKTLTRKFIAPDVGALVFALKNLRPDKWKNEDRVIVDNTDRKQESTAITATLHALKNGVTKFAEDEEYADE